MSDAMEVYLSQHVFTVLLMGQGKEKCIGKGREYVLLDRMQLCLAVVVVAAVVVVMVVANNLTQSLGNLCGVP